MYTPNIKIPHQILICFLQKITYEFYVLYILIYIIELVTQRDMITAELVSNLFKAIICFVHIV